MRNLIRIGMAAGLLAGAASARAQANPDFTNPSGTTNPNLTNPSGTTLNPNLNKPGDNPNLPTPPSSPVNQQPGLTPPDATTLPGTQMGGTQTTPGGTTTTTPGSTSTGTNPTTPNNATTPGGTISPTPGGITTNPLGGQVQPVQPALPQQTLPPPVVPTR